MMDLATSTRTNTDIAPPAFASYCPGQTIGERRSRFFTALSGGRSNSDSTSRAQYVEAITASMETNTKLVSPVPYVLPAANLPTALDLVFEKIRQLADLQPDWDGYASQAPAQEARDDAELFASFNVGILELIRPTISAASDGEVNYYWNNDKGLLDLGFYGDGTYSFYAELASGEEFSGDELLLRQPLPERLIEFFREV